MKVIHPKNLPTRMPLMFSGLVWLLLDRFDPAGWVHGAAWPVVVLFWASFAVGFAKEQFVDIFKEEK